ncbi:hypothetical protein Ddc_23989 [Ditylenchus destructor]|nr:hypothetical protein Ddc_23989 [Ditylenchus destructor]
MDSEFLVPFRPIVQNNAHALSAEMRKFDKSQSGREYLIFNQVINHRDSIEGEKRVGKYKLDGYFTDKNGRENAIEFLGCEIHGCLSCHPTDILCLNGRTAEENYARTMRRIDEISLHMKVLHIWECDVKRQLKENEEMRDFFEREIDTSPIDPNYGFFGGRVSPFRLYYKPNENEEIKYLDVCSLYPYVLPLSENYKVIKIIEVWQYDKMDPDLFRGYMNDFLRIKIEAQGFPRRGMTPEEKKAYIKKYEEKEGIQLREQNISDEKKEGLRYMKQVEEEAGGAPGTKLLYCDTDSVIFVQPKGKNVIEPGQFLGEMTDELPHHFVDEFCCGGNKQYALKLRDKSTGIIDKDYTIKPYGYVRHKV